MVGSSGTDGDSGASVFSRLVADYRMIAAMVAVVAGAGGAITTRDYFPPSEEVVRPNAWTSLQAAHSRSEMEREFERRIAALSDKMDRKLFEIREAQRQTLDSMNTHEGQGAHAVADSRISRLERDNEKCQRAMDRLREHPHE